MKIIPPPIGTTLVAPYLITDAMLVSSTAAEPGMGETVWVSGATYADKVERIRTQTHRRYQRNGAGTGTTPPESDPINWIDVGPTNKWAMFDLYKNTATVVTSPLTVVLAPGKRINSFGIVGLKANGVRVQLAVGSTIYYDRTLNTLLRNTMTWTDYLFAAFKYQSNAVLFDLPPVAGATLIITITGGAVECGGVIFEMAVDAGRVLSDAVNDGLNFSKVDRDKFGGADFLAKRSIQTADLRLLINKYQVPSLLALRRDLNAVPALYSGLDDKTEDDYFEAVLFVGFYKRFSISLSHPPIVSMALEEI